MALASSAETYSSPSGPKCAQCGRTSLPRSMTATVLARQVDDLNRTTVRARLFHPCVSVDGNVAEATVRGDSNLVSVNVNSHCAQNLLGQGIYQHNAVLHLVRNQQKIVWALVTRSD